MKTPEDETVTSHALDAKQPASKTIVSNTFYSELKSPPETGVKPGARRAHYPDNEIDEVDSDYDDDIDFRDGIMIGYADDIANP